MTIPAPATALPWALDGDLELSGNYGGTHVGGFVAEDDAVFAERACNSFPALVAALQGLIADADESLNRSVKFATLTNARVVLSLALGEQ